MRSDIKPGSAFPDDALIAQFASREPILRYSKAPMVGSTTGSIVLTLGRTERCVRWAPTTSSRDRGRAGLRVVTEAGVPLMSMTLHRSIGRDGASAGGAGPGECRGNSRRRNGGNPASDA
jgi:hypothetical protein